MKNVYFASFCVEMSKQATTEFLYLPYPVGTIWAYANTDQRIRDSYQLKEMYIKKMPIQEIVDELDNPSVFGFSSYVWNHNYNLQLAEQVKLKFPKCKIIFGGPQVSKNDHTFFEKHPFVDYAVYLEGEISFRDVLLDVLGYEVEFFGVGTKDKKPSGEPKRITDLEIIPSPYTAGYFDHVIKRHKAPNVIFNTVVETNRGCPFKCTFCDWGQTTQGKVKKFAMCRVHEDLLWCAKNDIDFLTNADANFGAFADRDMEIVEYLVSLNKKYGAPRKFGTSWHKNQNEKILAIADKLCKNNLMWKYIVAFQTLDSYSLEAIKRKNISLEQLDKIVAVAKENNVPTSAELMGPLPGQTKQSYLDDIEYLTKKDIRCVMNITTVLPGAEMANKDYQKKWGMQTRTTKIEDWSRFVDESEESLVATKDMTMRELESVLITNWALHHFHALGFTDFVSTYYNKKFSIKFTKFHEMFWQYFSNKDLYLSTYVKPLLNHVEKGHSYLLWTISNFPMINDLSGKSRDIFFQELKKFCVDQLPHTDDLDDLMSLQYNNQNYIGQHILKDVQCKSNLLDYILHNEDHQSDSTRYQFEFVPFAKNTKSLGRELSVGRYAKTWQTKTRRRILQKVV